MIALQAIDEIVLLALWSAYLDDEDQPISLIIAAHAEAGKTEQVKKAVELPGIYYPSDCTAYGILNSHGKDIMERKIRHIIIPDLITPLSKRWETNASFITFLNLLIADGIVEVQTKALSKSYNRPVKCGLIGCITPEELLDKRHKWLHTGFMSRLLPVSWSYKDTTQAAIFNYIFQGKRNTERWHFDFPKEDKHIEMPIDFSQALLPYTMKFAQLEETYGFRYQRHLQRLLKASALQRGSPMVQGCDLDRILGFVDFLNLKQNQV